jgi:16S rRNA (guanine527-N7)-methyltransferase
VELIKQYFPNLTEIQYQQLEMLAPLYTEWNEKINVISRKDMDHFYERHVLHSLGIAKVIEFTPGTKVLDVGTGGGFPGIPLAILFPEIDFFLVDSIGKKIKVVQEVAAALGLKNVRAAHTRAEDVKEKFDFVVSRAVTRLINFYPWVHQKFSKKQQNSLDNGILYLKGIDLSEEFDELHKPYQLFALTEYFKEEFFDTKGIIHVPIFS